MLMIYFIQKANTICSTNFNHQNKVRYNISFGNQDKDIVGLDNVEKQAKDLFDKYEKTLRLNSGHYIQGKLLPVDIVALGPISIVFSKWFNDE